MQKSRQWDCTNVSTNAEFPHLCRDWVYEHKEDVLSFKLELNRNEFIQVVLLDSFNKLDQISLFYRGRNFSTLFFIFHRNFMENLFIATILRKQFFFLLRVTCMFIYAHIHLFPHLFTFSLLKDMTYTSSDMHYCTTLFIATK